ncbi:MAG: cytoplasmic protein [Desulfobacterales bacterium]|nr:cytoplasmic protein [Desulfobacterales bacterium]
MADNGGSPSGLNFTVDKDHLYKEETITDLKVATLRQLTPIKVDGSPDPDREILFLATTQLNSPQGPVPIQAKIEAHTLEKAMDLFPETMEQETQKVIKALTRLQEEQAKKQRANESRIIRPGMN